MDVDELTKEVIENARKDRLALEKLRDNLTNIDPEQAEILEATPLAQLGVAENVARIHDVLVKVNSQLVELVKVKTKQLNPQGPSFSADDSIYDAIESKTN